MAITVTDLKKALKNLEHKELITLVAELFKINAEAKEFLSVKFSGEESVNELFQKTKSLVKNEFFPDRGHPKLRLAEAKKAIMTFKKITGDQLKTLDLMLYYVEVGSQFTNTYGDIDERFYNSMLSMFDKVADECEKDELIYKKFEHRMNSVVEEAEGIGWGYYDGLAERYYTIHWGLEDVEVDD